MEICIKIIREDIQIILKKGRKVLGHYVMEDKRDLGERLIPAVNQLLKKNKARKELVEKVSVISDQSDSFTTTRIAKAFAETWNMAVMHL